VPNLELVVMLAKKVLASNVVVDEEVAIIHLWSDGFVWSLRRLGTQQLEGVIEDVFSGRAKLPRDFVEVYVE
jgi:hypothetical protein